MILTARLTLRPARAGDLEDLHAVLSDTRAMRYWIRPEHTDLAETRAFLHAMRAQGPDTLDLIVERDGRAIGKAGLWRGDELGYILHPDHWGLGLASEALAALIPAAFAQCPDRAALSAEIDPRNEASARVLTKHGFRLTHVERRNFLYGGREWCDTAHYVLPRP